MLPAQMNPDDIELIEPCEGMGPALAEYIEEFRDAGEPFWQDLRRVVREDYDGYLRRLRDSAAGRNLPPGRVSDSQFWLVRGQRILGTIRIRHDLTPELTIVGGHIGYDVRPSERGKGFACRMLELALDKARRLGLRRVLLTCSKANAASAAVILHNGGRLENEVPSPNCPGELMQRYWIEL
jgi:predicted acetyltransferase